MKITTRPATITESRKNTGHCIHCGKVATKEMLFHTMGCIIIERYCDSCANGKLEAFGGSDTEAQIAQVAK